MHRNWVVRRTNSDYVSYLAQEASITHAFAQVLINRGVKDPESVRRFIKSDASSVTDPYAMSGMREAVAAIEQAVSKGTRIMVHGDYDADGVTATSIMVSALRSIGADAAYFIPNRFEHGYGFNMPGLEHAKAIGAGMVLTVDCGVSSYDAIEAASASGIRVVVTDHHELSPSDSRGQGLPKADAIVNPRLDDPDGPTLSGAGVALKLAQALGAKYQGAFDPDAFTDLAALGTLADSVPVLGENRAIVKAGLARIASGQRPGIAALLDAVGLDVTKLKAGRLIFTLVPRINAAGRIADASEVVELMLSDDRAVASGLAGRLNQLNLERQRIEETVYSEALAQVEAKGAAAAYVLSGEGWHEGVVGIVASKIAERYNRPAFVVSVKNGHAKGSARSAGGFDVHGGLSECSALLLGYGGHKQAAGLTLRSDDLPAFERAICGLVERAGLQAAPTLSIDASVSLNEISFRLIEELAMLEPYGYGNPEPVLGAKGLEVQNPRIVGKNHLKLRLRSHSTAIEAIGFNMGGLLDAVVEDTLAVDAAFTAAVNVWEDKRTLQLSLKGLRKSEA